MKSKFISIFPALFILFTAFNAHAQVYRAATTEVLQNDGRDWTEKKLPPSVITFSDYSGQVEIKAPISSLFIQNPDSVNIQLPGDTLADFIMTLDKDQAKQQLSTGKTFTTSGLLVINNICKKITAQCLLVSRDNPEDGFSISVILRFNPADFGMKIYGELENTPLIVKVTSGHLNKFQNNF